MRTVKDNDFIHISIVEITLHILTGNDSTHTVTNKELSQQEHVVYHIYATFRRASGLGRNYPDTGPHFKRKTPLKVRAEYRRRIPRHVTEFLKYL